jgi:ABC-type cobalamin/Fe3+-siderophores transport system ATPase subunit
MVLELLDVKIGQLIPSLSLAIGDGQQLSIVGPSGSGKTTLLRAILGFIPIDSGYISIDGELLTPLSAPYFRKSMAYVPQRLSLPEGYRGMGLERWDDLSADERYLLLLGNAVKADKPLLIVDEPLQPLSAENRERADSLLQEAAGQGKTIVAINSEILRNRLQL